MNRFLTLPADERRRWCEEAGARLGLEATSVEKDFWVCQVVEFQDLFNQR